MWKTRFNGKLIDLYDLVFLTVFAIKYSLRDWVKESVIKCRKASVNAIIIAGYNIATLTKNKITSVQNENDYLKTILYLSLSYIFPSLLVKTNKYFL